MERIFTSDWCFSIKTRYISVSALLVVFIPDNEQADSIGVKTDIFLSVGFIVFIVFETNTYIYNRGPTFQQVFLVFYWSIPVTWRKCRDFIGGNIDRCLAHFFKEERVFPFLTFSRFTELNEEMSVLRKKLARMVENTVSYALCIRSKPLNLLETRD